MVAVEAWALLHFGQKKASLGACAATPICEAAVIYVPFVPSSPFWRHVFITWNYQASMALLESTTRI